MSHTQDISELLHLIREELKDCDSTHWPNVCKMQSTELGRARLEEMIVRYIADEEMPIGSAIVHIEHELTYAS